METNNKKSLGGSLALLLAAFIWGTSFVAQSIGMERIQPFTFNGIRTLMGAAALVPLLAVIIPKKMKNDTRTPEQKKAGNRQQLICGLICGFILFVAGNLQQTAFCYTTSGKVGFVTALYMLLVPVFALVLGQRQRPFVWIAVLIGCVGVYLLCVNDGFSIGKGELLTMACAVGYAIHILYIDYAVTKTDGILLSFTQFVVAGTLSCICMFIFEEPVLADINATIYPLMYSGILSCGAAFTLQIVGQKNTKPAIAALLMCLESVFAVLSGWVILHETLSSREIIGCVVMFTAIILTKLPERKKETA